MAPKMRKRRVDLSNIPFNTRGMQKAAGDGGVGKTYYVKKIIDKYVSCEGEVYYLLRWKDFSFQECTWEPNQNVDCPELIADYERFLNRKRVEKRRRLEKKKVGFARKLRPRAILAITNNSPGGNLFYLMKWKYPKCYDMVSAVDANEFCPDLVLDFLERHFCYKSIDRNVVNNLPISDATDLETKENIKILGMTFDTDEKIAFVMIWDGLPVPEIVRYDQAREQIPAELISYFLSKLIWRK